MIEESMLGYIRLPTKPLSEFTVGEIIIDSEPQWHASVIGRMEPVDSDGDIEWEEENNPYNNVTHTSAETEYYYIPKELQR